MAEKQKKRSEIEDKYKWRLEDIYASDDLWEKDFHELKSKTEVMKKYKGKLTSDATNLQEGLELYFDICRLLDKVVIYSGNRKNEDLNVAKYQEMSDRLKSLIAEISSEIVFVKTELTKLTKEEFNKFVKENSRLGLYNFYMDEIFRLKKHVLSDDEEKLLAMASEIFGSPKNTFSMLNDADIKFPVLIDDKGNEVELTKGNYSKFIQSGDRNIRKEAFEKLYSVYMSYKNTFTSTLNSIIKTDVFFAKVRNYESPIKLALYGDNVEVSVYENLIETMHKNLDKLHRYFGVRKKYMDLQELHMYDIYVPMLKDIDKEISYVDAVDMVKNALKVLGEDYNKNMNIGFKSNWIDVYENEGKIGGAYSWGGYDTNPYILLNHQNNLNSLFTIAHEMGHSMHTFYSKGNQPYVYAEYTIFVAEVASTVNEVLLMKQLLKNTDNKEEKMYLLNHFMEEIRTTIYRQTQFAEFEKITHDKIQNGEALSADKICDIYLELNKLYYGENVISDDQIKVEWARIPHFYNSFYVYKYATSFSAAIAIAEKIDSGDKETLDNYLNFLKSGGSDYPIELLKKVGVDMSTPEPVQKALDFFGELVNEFEKLMNEK
ncbi:MAG TPA: oligoendopeptidase F [Clostridiales bacterium]|nr:MAG: oligoendopeptidase F [Clostridiales bacterium GWD2_32_59]HAN09901.1 oligoendopeptidase F [Clostridiales bacterium]